MNSPRKEDENWSEYAKSILFSSHNCKLKTISDPFVIETGPLYSEIRKNLEQIDLDQFQKIKLERMSNPATT
jgi:hypothetical protein